MELLGVSSAATYSWVSGCTAGRTFGRAAACILAAGGAYFGARMVRCVFWWTDGGASACLF